MNADQMAQAILHWLEFEWLCERSNLLSEASLKQPIGQYLGATWLSQGDRHAVEPEYNYPASYQPNRGRRRAMDFALLGPSASGAQRILYHAVETKFVNSKREFKDEIFDDLYRLAWFVRTREPLRCRRWLIVGGIWRNIRNKMLNLQIRLSPNNNRSDAFRGVLPLQMTAPRITVQVHNSNAARVAIWKEAAEEFDQVFYPEAFDVRLAARQPRNPQTSSYCCFIWEIIPIVGVVHHPV